jgi:glucose-1-phosphate adenylyltransferase
MGNYVISTRFLYEQLIKNANKPTPGTDFGIDIIPSIIENYQVFAYPFRDPDTGNQAFWRDVGTLDAFWEAHMELASASPDLDLYDKEWPILTYQAQMPSGKFVTGLDDQRGVAENSIVSGGCIISGGQVNRSLLFSNVRVHSYATVEDSVILPDVDIGRHCRIKKAIIDRSCRLAEGTVIGEDHEEDKKRGFRITDKGVVLVTRDMLGQREHYIE